MGIAIPRNQLDSTAKSVGHEFDLFWRNQPILINLQDTGKNYYYYFYYFHVSNVCTKAKRTLGFLNRNLSSCPQDVKEAAYKGLVRPVLEYASTLWDPHGIVVQEELE